MAPTVLAHKKIVKKKTNKFKRHQSDEFVKVKEAWRKPRGIDSRQRKRCGRQAALLRDATRPVGTSGQSAAAWQGGAAAAGVLPRSRSIGGCPGVLEAQRRGGVGSVPTPAHLLLATGQRD